MSSVVIMGCGRVGACFVPVLQEAGHEVFACDPAPGVETALAEGRWPHYHREPDSSPSRPALTWRGQQVDYALIVVPTPSNLDGRFNESAVLDACRRAWDANVNCVIVVSTLSPGTQLPRFELTNEEGPWTYAPTMIALGDVVRGIKQPGYWLVGGDDVTGTEKLIRSWAPATLFPTLTRKEAMLAKLATNVYLTMKISFANALAMACADSADGENPRAVLSAIGHDPRVGMRCLLPGMPFGGPCLPRDTRAMACWSAGLGDDQLWSMCNLSTEVNQELVSRAAESVPDDAANDVGVTSMSYKTGCELDIESFGRMIERELSVLGKVSVREWRGPEDGVRPAWLIRTAPGGPADVDYDPLLSPKTAWSDKS